jgi:hypothetical protein
MWEVYLRIGRDVLADALLLAKIRGEKWGPRLSHNEQEVSFKIPQGLKPASFAT